MNPLLLLLSLAATQPDPALLAGLEYRQLPLTRGGRSTAVTGVGGRGPHLVARQQRLDGDVPPLLSHASHARSGFPGRDLRVERHTVEVDRRRRDLRDDPRITRGPSRPLDPRDPRIMINGNDGGATVSLEGSATWSTQMNQPTGEMYRVAVDTGYPYRVYSAQQDAGAVSVTGP